MLVFIVGNSVTEPDKNVAVLGVRLPIIVLLIVVPVTGTVDPNVPIVPVIMLLTFIVRPETPDNSKADAEPNFGLANSLAVIFSPTTNFLVIPTPPVTFNEPVVDDVESMSAVMLTVLN